METKWVMLVLLVLVLSAVFIYFIEQRPEKDWTPFEKYLAWKGKLLEKNFTIIYYFNTSVDNATITMTKVGDNYYLKKDSGLYAWELYVINGTKYVCLKVGVNTACVKPESKKILAIATRLSSSLLNKKNLELEKKWFQIMRDADAFHFNVTSLSDGWKVDYIYNYSELTLSQLQQLGLSDSYLKDVPLFKGYYIIGKNGVLRERYRFYQWGKDYYFREVFINISEKENLPIMPQIDEAMFNTLMNRLEELLSLNYSNLVEVQTKAVELQVPELCRYSEDFVGCLDVYIYKNKDVSACELLDEQNKTDECYYRYANMDPYACNFIKNTTLKEKCIAEHT